MAPSQRRKQPRLRSSVALPLGINGACRTHNWQGTRGPPGRRIRVMAAGRYYFCYSLTRATPWGKTQPKPCAPQGRAGRTPPPREARNTPLARRILRHLPGADPLQPRSILRPIRPVAHPPSGKRQGRRFKEPQKLCTRSGQQLRPILYPFVHGAPPPRRFCVAAPEADTPAGRKNSTRLSPTQGSAPCQPHCGSAVAPPHSRRPAGISSQFCCRKMSEIPIYAGGQRFSREVEFFRTSFCVRAPARFILFRLTAEMIESLL